MQDVLLITWHGIHELDIFPGLPDTGGQNIYVQNMAEQIHDLYDCRVTILNRGGFPHPYTGRMREGTSKDPARELYVMHVADDIKSFVRKEYLTGALIEDAVPRVLEQLPKDYRPDLILSHFWDGGLMGIRLRQHFPDAVHVWTPHEPVGMKKASLTLAEQEHHGIFRRQRYEAQVLEQADLVASTSKLVMKDLRQAFGTDWSDKLIDIYPGVDTVRFNPLDCERLSGLIIREHAEYLNLPPELFQKPHICEFGRSDILKDKDQAVEAFALVAKEIPDICMMLNLDEEMEPAIAAKIHATIERDGLHERIHVFSPKELPQSGPGSQILPNIIKTSKVFLSMSVMEGFGMAACEAAASGVPVVGTDCIPVITDVIAPAGGGTVVPGKDPRAAADAVINYLRMDQATWSDCSRRAYESVIPRYTWQHIIADMLTQMKEHGYDLGLQPSDPFI